MDTLESLRNAWKNNATIWLNSYNAGFKIIAVDADTGKMKIARLIESKMYAGFKDLYSGICDVEAAGKLLEVTKHLHSADKNWGSVVEYSMWVPLSWVRDNDCNIVFPEEPR